MSRLTYGKYLKLKELLACQVLESAKAGRPAHDELLFIVTHQTYELWFKQVLHELGAARQIMGAEFVNERDVGRALHALERVIKIQGVQFRQLENTLGLKRTQRLRYHEADYEASLDAADRRAVGAAAQEPSLFDVVEAWLARMPFVQFREFDFWREYRANVTRMLDEDRATITAQLPDAARGAQLEELERTLATFESVFDPEKYEALRAAGERRLSYPAFLAALMIML